MESQGETHSGAGAAGASGAAGRRSARVSPAEGERDPARAVGGPDSPSF